VALVSSVLRVLGASGLSSGRPGRLVRVVLHGTPRRPSRPLAVRPGEGRRRFDRGTLSVDADASPGYEPPVVPF